MGAEISGLSGDENSSQRGSRTKPPHDSTATVCGTCLRGWDDSVVTSVTPAPSARCPFEYEHEET